MLAVFNNTATEFPSKRLDKCEQRLALLTPRDEQTTCQHTPLDGTGSGIAYEVLDDAKRRTMSADEPKISWTLKEHVACLANSRLRRTMADAGILQSIGEANDPNQAETADSAIITAYFTKIQAKQRWAKAGTALSSLKKLRIATGAEEPEAPEEAEQPAPTNNRRDLIAQSSSRARRISVTTLTAPGTTTDKAAAALPKKLSAHVMGKLPLKEDLEKMLKGLKGAFAFTIIDHKNGFIFAARSGPCKVSKKAVKLYWAVSPEDDSLLFSNEVQFIQEGDLKEFPQGHYYIGRITPGATTINTTPFAPPTVE